MTKSKTKKKIKEDLYFPHYWICHKCALERGGKWPKGHCATVVLKKCNYCHGKNHAKDEFIIPYVDFNWPNLDTKHLRD